MPCCSSFHPHWTWYLWQVQLYPIFASWQWGKNDRPYLLLMFPSCHPAGKILPLQNKFSKALFLVALIKCLCWLCFSSGHCLWEMEMQGSAGLELTEQLQIYCSSAEMNLKRGANCGHGWMSGGREVVSLQKQRAVNTHREVWMIQAKPVQILQQIWDLWLSKQISENLWESTVHTNSKSPVQPHRKM